MTDQTPQLPAPALAGSASIFLTGEEWIRVTARNSTASVALALGVRFLPLDRARGVVMSIPLAPTSDRAATLATEPLGEGWLLGFTVRATSGAPPIGSCFVTVDLVRGKQSFATVLQTLAQGYVTGGQGIAWPEAPLAQSLDGPGQIRSITGTDPAVAVEISETVPTGALWRLLSLRASLVTDANAANREVAITFDDGAAIYAEFHSGANQAASLTRQYTASTQGVRGAAVTATGILIAISNLLLPAGHRIRTATTNIQAGDNWSAPQLLVEEWIAASS